MMKYKQELYLNYIEGIGYFTLVYLIHCKAAKLIACEWNPASVEALRKNLILNKIDLDRCEILQGDNREVNERHIKKQTKIYVYY